MTSSVSQATLHALARRFDELAADFPTSPADVDPVALADHIGLLAHHLAHHLDHVADRTQERLATAQPVDLPERRLLAELADAATAITGALHLLTEALAGTAHAFHKEALPGFETSHLRNDPAIARIIACEKYTAARTQLTDTAHALGGNSATLPAGGGRHLERTVTRPLPAGSPPAPRPGAHRPAAERKTP